MTTKATETQVPAISRSNKRHDFNTMDCLINRDGRDGKEEKGKEMEGKLPSL